MGKKIAIQKELDNIKESLSSFGYEFLDMEDSDEADAIIYMADGYNIPYDNQLINMNQGDNMEHNQGAILINATGKTIEEINYIINNRLYSPLFE